MNLKDLFLKYPTIEKIFNIFDKNGFDIYLVGGAVRDFLLNEQIKDMDFTTNALPEEIVKMFEISLLVGAHFGTVQVILDGESFDITTFRTEADYEDGRHPNSLTFGTTLNEDLQRRDFTINGMALDKNGNLIDLFEGQKDLERGIIRTIGDPSDRFKEDALRKWRCIRFAAQKGFEIDPETHRCLTYDPDTSQVSLERIREELNYIILSDKVNWGGYLLVRTGVYPHLLRRLVPNVLERTEEDIQDLMEPFEIMYFMPKSLGPRLAALMIYFEIGEARTFLKSLGYSNKIIKETIGYLEAFGTTLEDGVENYKTMAGKLGRDKLLNLCKLQYAAAFVDQDTFKQERISQTQDFAQTIINENHPLTRSDLALNGHDLMELGFTGTEIKETFDYLLRKVYQNPKLNTRTKLIELLKYKETLDESDLPS